MNQRTRNPFWLIIPTFGLLFCILLNFYYSENWRIDPNHSPINNSNFKYYIHVPSSLIYHDHNELNFLDGFHDKYGIQRQTLNFQSVDAIKSTIYLPEKIGFAIWVLPGYYIAQLLAYFQGYPEDGLSTPYQVTVLIYGLVFCFTSVICLLLFLRRQFSTASASISIIGLIFCSMFFNQWAFYSSSVYILGFSLIAILFYLSDIFYERPGYFRALLIGSTLLILTSLHEAFVVFILVFLFWKLGWRKAPWRGRFYFMLRHFKFFIPIMLIMFLGHLAQFLYITHILPPNIGYFTWYFNDIELLLPNIKSALFNYNDGLLIYSPFFLFALPGVIYTFALTKKMKLSTLILPLVGFFWISADVGHEYDKRYHQSFLVLFPCLIFCICSLIEKILKNYMLIFSFFSIMSVGIIYNFWLTHQMNHGGLIYPGEMNARYFQAVLGKYDVHPEIKKLKDVEYVFTGQIIEADTIIDQSTRRWLCNSINPEKVDSFQVELNSTQSWIRTRFAVKLSKKQKLSQDSTSFCIAFYKDSVEYSVQCIQAHRYVPVDRAMYLWIDHPNPKKADYAKYWIKHHGREEEICIRELSFIFFSGKD
jgi:hypothetical protein